MPLLDVATAQTCSHSKLGPFRSQSFSNSLFVSKWCRFPKKLLAHERSRLVIKAVATLELKCVAENEGRLQKDDLLGATSNASMLHIDPVEIDEREKLRRMRISKANKGNTPWNKGRKHSPETLQRIRERTKLAMQNPKIKMKLASLGHAQSKETRMKIGLGVRMGWQKRRNKQLVQETCYHEWQNLIAEASRKGCVGEEELQWESYKIISENLELEWVQEIEQRKMMPRPKGSKRAPKSPEQRRKIAEAIAAKWADPEYRERVCSGLAKYHGIPLGAERKPRRKPSGGAQSSRCDPTKKKASDANSRMGNDASIAGQRMRRSKTPLYKDPLAGSKLEMIKSIRARRAVDETKKTEAIERAKLLIAEAQKAAKALEVAALKSPIAQASLLETRKLIAEATHLIESIGAEKINSDKNEGFLALYPVEQEGNVCKESDRSGADMRGTNGTELLASLRDEDLNFTNLKFHDMGSDEKGTLLRTGGGMASLSLESVREQSTSGEEAEELEANVNGKSGKRADALLNGSKVELKMENLPSKLNKGTKKWVRGRLVDVADES